MPDLPTMPTEEDQQLAKQPAAYWTRLAYESVIAYTRREQERRGYTQPQFWLLRHLSTDDLAADPEPRSAADLRAAMSEYIREEDDLQAAADGLVDDGFLAWSQDGYTITPAGEDHRRWILSHTGEIRSGIQAGIADVDYVVAIKVLKALIANTAPDGSQ